MASFRRTLRFPVWLLAVAGLAVAPAAAAKSSPKTSLELLAEYNLPGGARFEGACIGGLSALAFDPEQARYYAVSDSRRDARFFTLRIDLGETTGEDGSTRPSLAGVTFERVTRLRTREGQLYPDDRVDPEGLVLIGDGTAYLSSEGAADLGVPPFVDRIDLATGEWLATAPIPLAFKPRHDAASDGSTQSQGVRSNLGFESLTGTPDGRLLYAATESALAQDVGDPEATQERYARVLRFEVGKTPRLTGEFLYPLRVPDGNVVAHGLVEMLALDNAGRLLAMERTWGPEIGMVIKLFEVDLQSQRPDVDRSRLSPAARSLAVLDKQLVLDLTELPVVLDNLEGLTFGPKLADGSQSLLMLGDNDNTECQPPQSLAQMRPTKFLLFRLLY
ncbi:MAG: esterase-like activity of phytase family protein [Acidobacteriota bacterium]